MKFLEQSKKTWKIVWVEFIITASGRKLGVFKYAEKFLKEKLIIEYFRTHLLFLTIRDTITFPKLFILVIFFLLLVVLVFIFLLTKALKYNRRVLKETWRIFVELTIKFLAALLENIWGDSKKTGGICRICQIKKSAPNGGISGRRPLQCFPELCQKNCYSNFNKNMSGGIWKWFRLTFFRDKPEILRTFSFYF